MIKIIDGPAIHPHSDTSELLSINNFDNLLEYFKENIDITITLDGYHSSILAMRKQYPEIPYPLIRHYKANYLQNKLNGIDLYGLEVLEGYKFIGTYNALINFFNSYQTPPYYANELKKKSPGIYASLCKDAKFELPADEANIGKDIAKQLSEWLQKLYTGE